MFFFIIKLLNKWLKHRRLLRQFYIEIYMWTVEGCPAHDVFRQDRALCSTLAHWVEYKWIDRRLQNKIDDLLIDQFKRAGLNQHYPFNPESRTYYQEMNDCKLWANPKRVQWVHNHALQSLW